ncbi:hypothetical protein N2152v2_006917 [Parachlorella kessleri]
MTPVKPISAEYRPRMVGDITLDELTKYDGRDPYRALLLAVRGKVYDVTEGRAFYGPGGGYHVFAGKEVARALGKMVISEAECTDKLEDLSEKELGTLKDWELKFEDKYKVVGQALAAVIICFSCLQIVPPLELTLEQLAEYDGSKPDKPMLLLSIRGVIYNVSSGKEFYGPDGVYPFAGHETARAFAKFSTEVEDLTGNLEGCTAVELDALRDWEAKLYWKYPIVGRLVAGAK